MEGRSRTRGYDEGVLRRPERKPPGSNGAHTLSRVASQRGRSQQFGEEPLNSSVNFAERLTDAYKISPNSTVALHWLKGVMARCRCFVAARPSWCKATVRDQAPARATIPGTSRAVPMDAGWSDTQTAPSACRSARRSQAGLTRRRAPTEVRPAILRFVNTLRLQRDERV
jgi:hypothetical protein